MTKNDKGRTALDLILSYLYIIDKSEVVQEDFSRFDFNISFDKIWETLDILFQNCSPQVNIVNATLNAGIEGSRLLGIINRYGPPSTSSTSDCEGINPLHLAIEKDIDLKEGVSRILDANIYVLSFGDKKGRLPLHIVMGNKCTNTIEALEICGRMFIRDTEFHTLL